MAESNDKGTGKHPHRSTEEPYPHTKESGKEHSGQSQQHASSGSHSTSQGGNQSESSDLKSREYRDKEGNIHHHTHTAGKSEDK
jgi:hypothetical protein